MEISKRAVRATVFATVFSGHLTASAVIAIRKSTQIDIFVRYAERLLGSTEEPR